MDMIGRPKGNRLIIGGSGTSPLWRDLLTRLNHETGFDLKFQDDGFGPSDHSSFYGKDIAVLFFFTGVHRDYHKPSDDYEKIDIDSEEKILEFIFRTAQALNTIDHRPLFTKAKESNKQEATGEFRVYLGTIPDYGEEVEGVKLSGVREGSPAEKAGLKSGDVIVECAGKKIKNIYDYTYTLQEHKVGEVVDIIVLRNSQRLSLKATLERRPQ
jgi:C-terminal processing protease CtpA/Prc